MDDHVASGGPETVLRTSDVSSVLLNLKKSAAAMLQEKERSRHSESVWRERLNEKEQRVVELEHLVNIEQRKSASMASTMEEHKTQESYLSRRVRALTMLASELQERVKTLQGTVDSGEEMQTQTFNRCTTEEQMRKYLVENLAHLQMSVEELHVALSTAQADCKDKDANVATYIADIVDLKAEIGNKSLELAVKDAENSDLHKQLASGHESACCLREQLRDMEEKLTTAKLDKTGFQESFERARMDLSQLQDRQKGLLESMKQTEQQKAAVTEEKNILEQQMAAVTAEQVQHVLDLEQTICTLEAINEQQRLQHADQQEKVNQQHANEVETLQRQTVDLRSLVEMESHTVRTTKIENEELRTQLQASLELRLQKDRDLHTLNKDKEQLSGHLKLAQSCIVEREVQCTVSSATANAVIQSMDQINQDLQLALDGLTKELHDTNEALTHASHDQEKLRQQHERQMADVRTLMEVEKASQIEALAAARRQIEADMHRSLHMLEEQAANHVKCIQQNFTTAQSQASAKEQECASLQKRVSDLTAQIETMSNASKAAQAQWDQKEVQLCIALQDDRKGHEELVQELKKMHESECIKHATTLQETQEEMQALVRASQIEMQQHKGKLAEFEVLNAALQIDLDACRLKLSDLTEEAVRKDGQLKSLEAEVQKKAGLLKSISDKIATPDAEPETCMNANADDVVEIEKAGLTGPTKKRRCDKSDLNLKDASTAANRLSRKKTIVPPKPPGAPQGGRQAKNKNDMRRGRMAHMSSTTASKDGLGKAGGLTSTEIFGGLMRGF